MSKIDTQGMSGPVDPNYKGKPKAQKHKPWEITPRRCHTPQMVKELKILINEVLDEREGKFNYTSYFDVDKYKYYVGEEEPEYKPYKSNTWTENDGSTGECPSPPKYKPSYYQ
tara:strand:+ start:322 stop:660 length:339 start_codon:yes stop_codon:yes gene_type:complete